MLQLLQLSPKTAEQRLILQRQVLSWTEGAFKAVKPLDLTPEVAQLPGTGGIRLVLAEHWLQVGDSNAAAIVCLLQLNKIQPELTQGLLFRILVVLGGAGLRGGRRGTAFAVEELDLTPELAQLIRVCLVVVKTAHWRENL